jgi:hypothetical protein
LEIDFACGESIAGVVEIIRAEQGGDTDFKKKGDTEEYSLSKFFKFDIFH